MTYSTITQSDVRYLKEILGEKNVSTKEEDLVVYSVDAFPSESKRPDVIVWPESTEQVSEVVKYAYERGVPVVARGAGSSLTGAVIPLYGGIVLSTARMDKILEIRPKDMQASVQPGVIYDRLNEKLASYNLFFPPDPGSSLVCTIGGMVATNASGLRAVKYGVTRDYIIGLEVVLADGKVITVGSRTFKSSIGYDLTRLFVGSEGTLGIFCKIDLKLKTLPKKMVTIVANFDRIEDATESAYDMILEGTDPAAVEFLDGETIKAVNMFKGLHLMETKAMVLVEFHGNDDSVEANVNRSLKILRDNNAIGIKVARERKEREVLWQARKGAYPALVRQALSPISGDVIVPISKLTDLILKGYEIASKHNVRMACFGHVGDGNVHNIWLADKRDKDLWNRANKANEELVEYAISLGGAASAEHGIGLEKKKFMKIQHGEALDVMRRIKTTLDPKNILNPGKIFE